MAISEKAVAAWGTSAATTSGSVTIPGTPADGDRLFFWSSWKDFSVTAQVTDDGGVTFWNEVTEFADGSVAAGNGTGSMKVGCWWKDWVAGMANPVINWSASIDVGSRAVTVLQKDASETWDTPTFVTGTITAAANPFSSTSTSTLTVSDGALVFELCGIRDDSATFTRSATTALEDDGSPNVTWNGNVVESPATHQSTTSGGDMASDLIYRLVTTGAAGVNLTATGTLSATETGSILWVHQSVTTSAAERVPYFQPYTQLLAH